MRIKKAISENALKRIVIIDGEIAMGNFPNCTKLGEHFGRSPMTIQRDIDFMRSALDAPIGYDAGRRGYYYTEKTYRAPLLYISKEDAQVLAEIIKLIAEHKDMAFHQRAIELLDSITITEMDFDRTNQEEADGIEL
jgi:predicted DNA-binding transcriptional regulator YafY